MRQGNGKGSVAILLAAVGLTACAPTSDGLRDNKASRAAAASDPAKARNPYSPHVLTDPYVLDQQRATVEALRRNCEQTREHCGLAADAGRYLDEQKARR